jgi:hypothetical protein
MQATNRIFAVLWIVLVAAALVGATVWIPGHVAPDVSPWIPGRVAPGVSPVTRTESPAPMVGTFTGEFENGVPVHRLPAITVTTNRSVELARMAREEQFAPR